MPAARAAVEVLERLPVGLAVGVVQAERVALDQLVVLGAPCAGGQDGGDRPKRGVEPGGDGLHPGRVEPEERGRARAIHAVQVRQGGGPALALAEPVGDLGDERPHGRGGALGGLPTGAATTRPGAAELVDSARATGGDEQREQVADGAPLREADVERVPGSVVEVLEVGPLEGDPLRLQLRRQDVECALAHGVELAPGRGGVEAGRGRHGRIRTVTARLVTRDHGVSRHRGMRMRKR